MGIARLRDEKRAIAWFLPLEVPAIPSDPVERHQHLRAVQAISPVVAPREPHYRKAARPPGDADGRGVLAGVWVSADGVTKDDQYWNQPAAPTSAAEISAALATARRSDLTQSLPSGMRWDEGTGGRTITTSAESDNV